MTQKKDHQRNRLAHRSASGLMAIILIATQWTGHPSGAQTRIRMESARESSMSVTDSIDRAVFSICEGNGGDRKRTVPIDQMALQTPLALTHPQVVKGKARAQRLLPVAKRLLPAALNQLGLTYQAGSISQELVNSRIRSVTAIEANVADHDNASVRRYDPRAITFGTVFLAGLRSDEAMIAVLAHELTHVVDGPDHLLQPLFSNLRARASQLSGNPIQARPAIELTCEMAGLYVLVQHLGGASKIKGKQQRLARAFQKNCVTYDLADDRHLSPRQTLEMLLLLEPELTRAVVKAEKRRSSD